MALELGEENPIAMLERLPAHVMSLWHAYFNIEPFGYRRVDMAVAAAAFGSARVANAKRGKRFGLDDFMIDYTRSEKSPEEMRGVLRAAVGAFKRASKRMKR